MHANSLRFLERDLGKKKPKLDLIMLHTAVKISQMLKVKDKVVYCAKCGSAVGKSGAPKGVPCRSIAFIDASSVYAVLGKTEICEDKWSGKAHRMMSNSVGPISVEHLSKSQSEVKLLTLPGPRLVAPQTVTESKTESSLPSSDAPGNSATSPPSVPSVPVEISDNISMDSHASSMPLPPKRLKPTVPTFF